MFNQSTNEIALHGRDTAPFVPSDEC